VLCQPGLDETARGRLIVRLEMPDVRLCDGHRFARRRVLQASGRARLDTYTT
jgi:hypothetical protein